MLTALVVIAALFIAAGITFVAWTYVKDSDDAADTALENEYTRLGVESLASYTYDETDAEKRVRIGAPALDTPTVV